MPSKPAPAPKKQPLTLAQLAAYDDILTDALIDHAFYWTTIPKNRPSYHASRGVHEEEITKIIQDELVVAADLDAAEQKFLAIDGIRRFYSSLKSPKEKDDFRRHLRRYMQIYLPDCPFEVSSTNRYTIFTHEASVTARRSIRKNDVVKYLSGIQVNITPEEEQEIAFRKKDFSIVVSSRSKCASLFMGPARFANHDCDANGRLVTTGQAGIEIIATRDIDVGDEITVTYGENYFGEDNCECLCKSCEDGLVNGWTPEDGQVAVRVSIEQDPLRGYSLRRRRRDDSVGDQSRTSSVTPDIRPRVPKTRTRTQKGDAARDSPASLLTPGDRSSKLKRPFDELATPPITPYKKHKTGNEPEASPLALARSRSSRSSDTPTRSESGGVSERDYGVLTDITSPEQDPPEVYIHSPKPKRAGRPALLRREEEEIQDCIVVATTPLSPRVERPTSRLSTPEAAQLSLAASTDAKEPDVQSQAPGVEVIVEPCEETIAISVETDTPVEGAPRRKRKWQRRTFVKQATPPSRVRVPGDYTLTPLLLSEPAMAWIHCTVCNTAFVQQNAYYTRSSCPRCERHSKLYGYIWPKTERSGNRDKEERVLDHRTVHRFLDPEDEAKVRGRKWKFAKSSEPETPPPPSRRAASKRQRGRTAETGPDEGWGLRRSGRTRKSGGLVFDD